MGCRAPIEELRFLNFDAESSGDALVSGWSGFETGPGGDTYCWCRGREARLRVQSRADGDRLVRVRCWPFRYPGAGPQRLTVHLNGVLIDTLELAEGPAVYRLVTPQAAWRPGPNELRFSFAYAEAPRDHVPGSADDRTLSAAFDWIEIVPLLSSYFESTGTCEETRFG